MEQADLSQAQLVRVEMKAVDLNGARMTSSKLVRSNLSLASAVEADMSASVVTHTPYPGIDISGTNLVNTGIFKEQALNEFPDIIYSGSTRWDQPKRKLGITSLANNL